MPRRQCTRWRTGERGATRGAQEALHLGSAPFAPAALCVVGSACLHRRAPPLGSGQQQQGGCLWHPSWHPYGCWMPAGCTLVAPQLAWCRCCRYLQRAISAWARPGSGSRPGSFSNQDSDTGNGGSGRTARPGEPALPAALRLGQVHRAMTLPRMGQRSARHRSLQAIRVDMAAFQAGSSGLASHS